MSQNVYIGISKVKNESSLFLNKGVVLNRNKQYEKAIEAFN